MVSGSACDDHGRHEPVCPSPVFVPRRVYRDTEDRFLAGVASGVAQHLGVEDDCWCAIAFLVMVLWSGFGVLLYAALWALVPLEDPTLDDGSAAPGLASASRRGFRATRSIRRRDVGLAASIGAMALGGIVLLQNLGLWVSPRLFWPLLVAATGIALLWRQADEQERQEWLSTSSGWRSWLRVVVGMRPAASRPIGIGLFQSGVSGQVDLTDVLMADLLAMLGVAWCSAPGRCGSTETCAASGPSASAPRSVPTSRRTCTTRCCRRWP